MLEFLNGIAETRGVLFVVGLIDEYRRNCAYLIDGEIPPRLICQKVNRDTSREYNAPNKATARNRRSSCRDANSRE